MNIKKATVSALFAVAAISAFAAIARDIDIRAFGAVGDGKTLNTTFVQKAIAGARAKLYPGIGLSCWEDDGTDAMKMVKHIQALRKDGLEGFTVFNLDARAERAFPIL